MGRRQRTGNKSPLGEERTRMKEEGEMDFKPMVKITKWRKVILIATLLLGVSCPSVFGQSKPANGYVKKQILFLKWGHGNNEIGLEKDHYGPTGFAVDKNENIYITDPWNKRILVFSINGKLIKSVPSDALGPSLEVNDDGDIYTSYEVNNRGKILRITSNGERKKFDQDWGGIHQNAVYDSRGEKVFSFDNNKSVSSGSLKFNEPLFLKKDVSVTYDKRRGGNGFLNIKTEKINRTLQKQGKSAVPDLIKIHLVDKPRLRLDHQVLGFDNDGNVYILMGYIRNHYMDLTEEKIQVYSVNSVLVAEIPLDIDFSYNGGPNSDFFRVDNQGNIFQLLNTETGVCVYKWIKE